MKKFNYKKILMTLALVIIIQNGAIIVTNTDGNTGSYSEDSGIAPYSDLPDIDESYN